MTLREMLLERHLSLAEVEVRARVSIATVRRAIRGKVPRPLYVSALARLLKVSAAEVVAAIEAGATPENPSAP